MGKKKPSTLYPDNRGDFYSEWEEWLLMNGDLIILLSIIGVTFVIILILVLNASFFSSPYTLIGGV